MNQPEHFGQHSNTHLYVCVCVSVKETQADNSFSDMCLLDVNIP